LQGGGVADAHRPRVAVSVQVAEVVLGEGGLAAEAVENLYAGGVVVLLRRALQELQEGDPLFLLAEERERLRDHAGVADPAEAVVPVPDSADLLGQGRG